jgi:5-methylcytosine-specific restriction endonuclease McrA
MNINKHTVLKLNSGWQPVGTSTIAEAIVDMVAGISGRGVDIQYYINPDGTPDLTKVEYMNPVSWEDWIELPVMPWHEAIHSPRLTIRAPTVMVAPNCIKMPKKKFKDIPSREGVWIRDGGICQYTGRRLSKDEASVDHVTPRSRGGRDVWTNVVITSKDLNREKGNNLNSEAGLRLLKTPTKPADIPLCLTIREARHPDWEHFLVIRD